MCTNSLVGHQSTLQPAATISHMGMNHVISQGHNTLSVGTREEDSPRRPAHIMWDGGHLLAPPAVHCAQGASQALLGAQHAALQTANACS